MNWMAFIEKIKSEIFSLLTKCGMILSYNFDLVQDITMILLKVIVFSTFTACAHLGKLILNWLRKEPYWSAKPTDVKY